MILSFKKKFPWGKKTDFENKILSGKKIHSIREDAHGRWNPGKHIHFANGVRTKNYNCFLEKDCVSVQAIQIHHYDYRDVGGIYRVDVIVDGKKLEDYDLDLIAENDGFENFGEFLKFFSVDFQGRLIHWTDLKY